MNDPTAENDLLGLARELREVADSLERRHYRATPQPETVDPYCPFHGHRPTAYDSCSCPADPCHICGPGYRIGKDGCRHIPPALGDKGDA